MNKNYIYVIISYNNIRKPYRSSMSLELGLLQSYLQYKVYNNSMANILKINKMYRLLLSNLLQSYGSNLIF